MQGALLPLLYLRSLSPLFSSLANVPASSCRLSFNGSLLLPLYSLFFCWKICESQRSNYVRIRICSKHLLRGCGVTTFSLEFFWIRDSMQATCQKSQKQRPNMISFLSDELMFILEDPTRSHHFWMPDPVPKLTTMSPVIAPCTYVYVFLKHIVSFQYQQWLLMFGHRVAFVFDRVRTCASDSCWWAGKLKRWRHSQFFCYFLKVWDFKGSDQNNNGYSLLDTWFVTLCA